MPGSFCNRGAQFIAAPHGAPLIESTSCESSHPWIPRRNIDLEKSGSESASAILYRTCSRSFKNNDAISETRPEIELARKHFRFGSKADIRSAKSHVRFTLKAQGQLGRGTVLCIHNAVLHRIASKLTWDLPAAISGD